MVDQDGARCDVARITSNIEMAVGTPTHGTDIASTQAAMLSVVLQRIEDSKLGLQGLIKRFDESGMQSQVQSWIAESENAQVTSEQIVVALGPEFIEGIAAEAGLPGGQATEELVTVIPLAIDRLTPGGVIPDPGCIQQAASLVRSKLAL